MLTISKPKFIYDEAGNKTEVIIALTDFEKYIQLLEDAEDTEDVYLYDQAKQEDDGSYISLEEMKSRLGLP